MKKEFFDAIMWVGHYVISPYTSSSYYAATLEKHFELINESERRKAIKNEIAELVQNGEEWLLPHRLGILQGSSMISTSRSGRASKPMDAQLKAAYTIAELSPYKVCKPFEVQTGLWKVDGTQSLYYGSLGITGGCGRVDRDNGDLIIVSTSDWRRLEIFIFRGLAGVEKQMNYLPEVVAYIKDMYKQ